MYYNWAAVDDTRGLCPKGWHVPTDAEWTELEEYVGSKSEYVFGGDPRYIAKALASNVGWYETVGQGAPGCEPDKNNATGFSAVPAGYYYGYGGGYDGYGSYAIFWSSTEEEHSNDAYYRSVYYYDACLSMNDVGIKSHGFSLRCIRDN